MPNSTIASPRSRFPRPQVLAPMVVLVFGAIAMWMSIDLSLGSLTEPQPGLWPFLVSIVIVATAAALLFTDDPGQYERWGTGTFRVAAGVAGLACFVVLFQIFGFLLSAFLLLLSWMRLHGREPWKLAVPLAVAGAVALQILFVDLFGVPFPETLIVVGLA